MEFCSATPELAMNRRGQHLRLHPSDTTHRRDVHAAKYFSQRTLSSNSATIHRKAVNPSQPPLWLSYLVDAFTQQVVSSQDYQHSDVDSFNPSLTSRYSTYAAAIQTRSKPVLKLARSSTSSSLNKLPLNLRKRQSTKGTETAASVAMKRRTSQQRLKRVCQPSASSSTNLRHSSVSIPQAPLQTPRMASSVSSPSTSNSSTFSTIQPEVSNKHKSYASSPSSSPLAKSRSKLEDADSLYTPLVGAFPASPSSGSPARRKRRTNDIDDVSVLQPTKRAKSDLVNFEDAAVPQNTLHDSSDLSAPGSPETPDNPIPRKLCLEDEFREVINAAATSGHQTGPRTRRMRNSHEKSNTLATCSDSVTQAPPKVERVIRNADPDSQSGNQFRQLTHTEEHSKVSQSLLLQHISPAISKMRKEMTVPSLEAKDLTFEEFKSRRYWSNHNYNNETFYAADGITQHPSSQRDSSAKGSPRKRSRGGGATRGRSNGNGNGVGKLKSRFRGRGGRDDTPEPPPRKRNLTIDEDERVKKLKARQQELKRFFSIVGAHQMEMLDQLASKDLNKMIRKAKAHKSVPEHVQIVEDLENMRDDACVVVDRAYASQIDYENEHYEREKMVIESQYLNHCKEAQMEYHQGCEGDMALLKQAHAAAEDDTRTETGSEIDYFPRYHEFPEADAHVRGYVSHRLTDEKPFKQYLATYDDQARQEVIDEDLIRPMIQAINDRNKEHREEQQRKKTQNMQTLSEEAIKQLEEIKGYLAPRPLYASENASYALSALADVSDWVAQQYPEKQYIYLPLAPGDTFPQEALETDPPRGKRQLAPAPSAKPVASASTPMHSRPYSQVHRQVRARNDSFVHNNINGYHTKPVNALPTTAPTPLPHLSTIVHGLGPPIAPAPPKTQHISKSSFGAQLSPITTTPLLPHGYRSAYSPTSSSPLQNLQQNFHQTALPAPVSRANSGRAQGTRPQQYNFLPPQQPVGHKSAPLISPTSASGSSTMAAIGPILNPSRPTIVTPTSSVGAITTSNGRDPSGDISGAIGGSLSTSSSGSPFITGVNGPQAANSIAVHAPAQGKIPVTFVNQTIASRKAAAEAASQQAAQRALDDRGQQHQSGMIGGRLGGAGDKKRTGSVDGRTNNNKSGPRLLLPKV